MVFLLFAPQIGCAEDISPTTLPSKIDKILDNRELKHTKMGVKVISLDKGDTLFEKNADLPLIPASNAKIITAATALKLMKPSYKFKTSIFTNGKIQNGVLNGNLYIKGTGDTFFVTEQIYYIANELSREGFKEVTGNLIIDDTYFDIDYKIPSGDRAFVAPVGAVSANFNSIAIYVRPGKRVGDPAIVILDPPNSFVSVKNKSQTVSTKKKTSLNVKRISAGKNKNKIEVTGKISINTPERRYYRSISNPPIYAGAVIQSVFAQRGIKIRGDILRGKTPKQAKELLQYNSKSLALVTKDLLNFSNNMIADQLVKSMGAFKHDAPGSMKNGLDAIKEELTSMGIPLKNFKLVDGSGFDRKNRLTAEQILKVMEQIQKDPELFPAFWFGMTVAGIEGTLEKRFLKTAAKGRLRAKTGSLTGVSSLVGFAPSADGELLAFAILMNDSKGKSRELQRFQDQIGDLLCRFSRRQ
ncbi:D-alanyl-D-alanine carboxypeptidase/D-alanyl-D-alanine-endopeptidase [Bdellovibrionota bacterium]